jgi:hypothetical protein
LIRQNRNSGNREYAGFGAAGKRVIRGLAGGVVAVDLRAMVKV